MLEGLAKEIESFIQDLNQQGINYQRAGEREKFDFVNIKESIITEFSKTLDQNSVGANSANVQTCEQLLFQA